MDFEREEIWRRGSFWEQRWTNNRAKELLLFELSISSKLILLLIDSPAKGSQDGLVKGFKKGL